MHYTFHQLSILVAVAEEKSITKAAERLHLTQPAISIQLKKLQEQFDIPLIEVVGRKIFVTPFGESIVESAERILEEAQKLENQIISFRGGLAGDLSVSIVSTAKYIMPYLLTEFIEANQGVKLHMEVTNKGQVVKHLEENKVDFAMVSVLPNHMKLNTLPLMENQLYLVGRKTKKHIDLSKEPLIFRERGSATRLAMEAFLKSQKIVSERSLTLQSNEAVKQTLLAGMGYSVMPLIGIVDEIKNGDLHLIPHEGLPVSTQWNLVWLKAKKLSPVAKAYVEYLKENHLRVIEDHFGSEVFGLNEGGL